MSIFIRLFGNSKKAQAAIPSEEIFQDTAGEIEIKGTSVQPEAVDRGSSSTEISQEAAALVSSSLEIIESQVNIDRGFIQISTGVESKVMVAAYQLEEAHKRHPLNPQLHYAWASALHLAAQFKSAEDEMKDVVKLHPDFLLAKYAIRGWERWKSPFTLPSWTSLKKSVPQSIAERVITTILLSVRDGISPRATLFLRDVSGDFQDLKALHSAKIDMTSVISPVTDPQLMAIYVKIWDNLQSPYDVEALEAPLHLQGHPTRCTFEYFFLQQDMDFVVIDNTNNILLNKRLAMPDKMIRANQQLLKLLESSPGREISAFELVSAIQSHQRLMSPSNVSF